MPTVQVQYYAILREERGLREETVETQALTVTELFEELRTSHGFTLDRQRLKVVVNEEFCDWSRRLEHGDTVVFIPPVAGG